MLSRGVPHAVARQFRHAECSVLRNQLQLLTRRRPTGIIGAAQARHATTVFNVRPPPDQGKGEQTLFVVGLNEGKFFGQDGSEEALKLLERIVENQGANYNLLFSLTEREWKEMEADHPSKQGKLTPSRTLEGTRNCEFVPVMQAGQIDKCGRRALGRLLKTTQNHVAWQLFKHPRECIKLWWLFWRRKEYKNAALREFWMKNMPTCAYTYYEEYAELVVIRTVELMMGAHNQGKAQNWVLVTSNEFYSPIVERLTKILDEEASEKFQSKDFPRHLRERATELCIDVPDLVPVLVFIYLGLPLLGLQTLVFIIENLWEWSGVEDQIIMKVDRE